MSLNPKRHSKKAAASIELQDRDFEILRGLFECRVMTGNHISALYFEDRDEAAKKRIQKLKASDLLGERPRRAFEPAVLFLTRGGLIALRDRGILTEYPSFDLPVLERRAQVSKFTLAHEIEVVTLKANFHSLAPRNGRLSVAEFSTWPLLNQFTVFDSDGDEVCVKPDGLLRLHEKEPDGGVSEHAFFVEVDRSTESQDVLVDRAGYYLSYYKAGGFAERHGAKRTDFKEFPFRVLMVFKTAERRNNIAERLLHGNPPIFTHVYLSTQEEVAKDPFGAVWIRPVDYRDAIAGSLFAETGPKQRGYQPRSGRDKLLKIKLPKRRLTE